jgi:hypothetical protein
VQLLKRLKRTEREDPALIEFHVREFNRAMEVAG